MLGAGGALEVKLVQMQSNCPGTKWWVRPAALPGALTCLHHEPWASLGLVQVPGSRTLHSHASMDTPDSHTPPDGLEGDVATATTRDPLRLTTDLPQQLIKTPGRPACLAVRCTERQEHPAPKPSFPSDSLHDLGRHITSFLALRFSFD